MNGRDSQSNAAQSLDHELASLSLSERLTLIAERFANPVFTTSLGLEDQVLTFVVAKHARNTRLATLETGRLFPETLSLLDITKARFGLTIEEFHPDGSALEDYISRYGRDGFYDSVEARKACCRVRKLDPLDTVLIGADAWITGLRRDQSDHRSAVAFAEFDEEKGLTKLNPLADWTMDDLLRTIDDHEIPVNPLHLKGYPSIGCEPCTRAIKAGEDVRAGRWWWESDMQRECGLHLASETPSESVLQAG